MSESNPVHESPNSIPEGWGWGELAPGDYEFHFWEAATDLELIGSRIRGRWAFERKQDNGWHPTPATEALIELAEEFVARREAQRTG